MSLRHDVDMYIYIHMQVYVRVCAWREMLGWNWGGV